MDIDYSNIKRIVERNICPEHGEHAKFIKTPEGFSVSACCEDFRNKMIKVSNKAMEEETAKAIDKMMRDAFK